MRVLLLTCLILCTGLAGAAAAASNQLVTCHTWRARAAGAAPGAPALAAAVPGAMRAIPLNDVLFTNSRLARRIMVAGTGASRTPEHAVKLFVRLVNCRDTPLIVELRSHFLDDRQLPTEPASPWRSLVLSPRATAGYEETSLTGPRIAAYYVEVRPSP